MFSKIKVIFLILILISQIPKIKNCSSNEIELTSTNCIPYSQILNNEIDLTVSEVEKIYSTYKNKITLLQDVYFEILKTTDFKNSINEINKLISTIEVTDECVDTLIGTISKSDMYIFKFDSISSESYFNKVKFVLFHEGEFIYNPICTSSPIIITYPIRNDKLSLNDTSKTRMNLVIKSEYDPFNKNSKFFTDICTQFTSEDNTDVPLDDRKNDYFIKLDVCDSENENSIYYNYISDNVNNELYIQCKYGAFENDEEKKSAVDIVENGLNTVFKHSNLKVVKCNKMLFKLKYFKENYGGWIMMGLFVLQIAFLIYYLIFGTIGIYDAIKEFFKKKGLYFKEDDKKTKDEENVDINNMNTNRISIKKSKTKEVRKAVTENLEIRYQDYANPPLKKKNNEWDNDDNDDEDFEINNNFIMQKPKVTNEVIRTKMSMLDTIQSKNFGNKKDNSNQNIPKVNKNQSKKVNSNNYNFGDLDNFENNDDYDDYNNNELNYKENIEVDDKLNNKNGGRNSNNLDSENEKMIPQPRKYYDPNDDRPIKSGGFYNLDSIDTMNDLLESTQKKSTQNSNKNDNKNNNKFNKFNNAMSQEIKPNKVNNLNNQGNKFNNTNKSNSFDNMIDSNDSLNKNQQNKNSNNKNNYNNNPLNNSANPQIPRVNSRYAHLQMSADNPFNFNPQNTYNNNYNRNINNNNQNNQFNQNNYINNQDNQNIQNKNKNNKNNQNIDNDNINNQNKNIPINKSQSFNNNYDDIPVKSQNNIPTSKSVSINKDIKSKKQDALKMLNGTLHKVDEEEKSENESEYDNYNNNNNNSTTLKNGTNDKNKFNNIDIRESAFINKTKKTNKTNSSSNYYPSDLNDRKSYNNNRNTNTIEENIQNENKEDENLEVNRSNRSNKSDVIGTTGHLFDYTDEELNDLPYEKAFYADGRSYYRYYWSILKYDQLFLFSFILSSDFNLRLVKVSLFFFQIPMYLTFNGFFFSDTAARNLYQKKGIITLLERLPSSIFSSLICLVIVILLKCFCLSQKKVQDVRSSKTFDEAYEKTKVLVEVMKPRIIIYFVFVFIFMLIFVYYCSLFCIVFKNTQWKLFQETAISFALGMVYPLIICIFPTIFRKIGLVKQKVCAYKFSQILQLF